MTKHLLLARTVSHSFHTVRLSSDLTPSRGPAPCPHGAWPRAGRRPFLGAACWFPGGPQPHQAPKHFPIAPDIEFLSKALLKMRPASLKTSSPMCQACSFSPARAQEVTYSAPSSAQRRQCQRSLEAFVGTEQDGGE